MFGLPMEVIAPVLALGTIIAFITTGIIAVRRFSPPGRRVLDGEDRQVLDDLQARLTELDDLRLRVGELEERVDFSERILAQRDEAKQVGPPKPSLGLPHPGDEPGSPEPGA